MIANFLAVSADKIVLDGVDIIPCDPDSDEDKVLCELHCELLGYPIGLCWPSGHRHICKCFD